MPTSARETRETAREPGEDLGREPIGEPSSITARHYGILRLVRVIIADDHRLMREGTAALLAADPRIEVVGLASGGREAVELAARLEPDVALLDVGMPDIGGVEACAAIRARVPGVAGADAHGLRGCAGRAGGAAGRRRRLPAQGHAAGRAGRGGARAAPASRDA